METKTCMNCGNPLTGRRTKFCDTKCQQEFQYKQFIKRWKTGQESGVRGEYAISRHIRRYMLKKAECRCELCGWGEKNIYTDTVPLEIHHKDGDFRNNTEGNLQVLCPNCHALTSTYKNRNHNGRAGRKKYY